MGVKRCRLSTHSFCRSVANSGGFFCEKVLFNDASDDGIVGARDAYQHLPGWRVYRVRETLQII